MAYANFRVDTEKCIGCGMCLNVCPGNMVGGDVLRMEDGHPVMRDQKKFGWMGCWRCQHCMAICPEGAVSVLGVSPDDVSGRPDIDPSALAHLMKYRRTCRDFKKEDVSPEIIDYILDAVCAVPTGGNNFRLEFTCVSSRASMRELYRKVFSGPEQLNLFGGEKDSDDLSALRLYDAPHVFIAHKEVGERFRDGDHIEMTMATAYFELLANACGLGTCITTYCCELLSKHKEALEYLHIPASHSITSAVAFGYPEYEYARGVEKKRKITKV